jgi:hypothetical protein
MLGANFAIIGWIEKNYLAFFGKNRPETVDIIVNIVIVKVSIK